ncbi:MAG: hypothetical protein CL454_00865 [Acidimicrobiaceae bacterium]|nr:hypothetical protein [Acidimicrobiaceae bacterium]
MSIRVPVKFRFQAPLNKVMVAYQQKMIERSSSPTTRVRVEVVDVQEHSATYKVTRTMPTWYRLLGGRSQTEYVETLTLEDGKMITSAKQNLPFGGQAETKIIFVDNGGTETAVFGTVSASNLPKAAQTVVKRMFRGFVQKTFAEERTAETTLLSNSATTVTA